MTEEGFKLKPNAILRADVVDYVKGVMIAILAVAVIYVCITFADHRAGSFVVMGGTSTHISKAWPSKENRL